MHNPKRHPQSNPHLNPPRLPNNPTQSRKSSTNGRSPFKANCLASARDEWENKVKTVETNLGSTVAKFDAGLAGLALLQRQQQQLELSGNGDIENGFPPGNRHGGLATPSLRSLSADSNRPRQRGKKASSSCARGRSASRGRGGRGGEVDRERIARHPSNGLILSKLRGTISISTRNGIRLLT
jgi:hypothetical protein